MDPFNPYNYPNKQPDKKVRHTFKCLSCKHRWAREFTKHQAGWRYSRSFFYEPTWQYLDYLPGRDNKCPACGSDRVDAKPITGKKNASVPCDRRCTGAHGHDCECSCGGENHGKDHVIQL